MYLLAHHERRHKHTQKWRILLCGIDQDQRLVVPLGDLYAESEEQALRHAAEFYEYPLERLKVSPVIDNRILEQKSREGL